jgi:hypothetical protein
MPSPFPGMDPYIETPELWSDFHGDVAAEIRARLNRQLPATYVARLTPYVTYEIIEVTQVRGVRPDVGVWRAARETAPIYDTEVVTASVPFESAVPLEAPLQLLSIELRVVETLELVTAIEILSPVNKRPGHEAHRDYQRKRRELLRSSAHFIEIDLLRSGERSPLEIQPPTAPYYVTLSRATHRPKVDVWPIQLWDKLPIIPVPLLEPDPDARLDLNEIVASVYERGAYGAQIDYGRAPLPPLAEQETRWLDEHLRQRGVR